MGQYIDRCITVVYRARGIVVDSSQHVAECMHHGHNGEVEDESLCVKLVLLEEDDDEHN